MNAKQKLQAVRERLAKAALSGYLQPVHDEYLNEYPPASARRVEWLCGFSGSAGTAAVLKNAAALFIDGRYVLQAKAEVDPKLYEQHNIEGVRVEQWLSKHVRVGDRIGYDPKLFTRDAVRRIEAALAKKDASLVASENIVDALWQGRPAAPASPVKAHEAKYSGETSASKRGRIADSIKKAGADAAVIAAPDSVCWLLNIRGQDTDHSPLVMAPFILDANGHGQLFLCPGRCDAKVFKHLGLDVLVRSIDELEDALKEKSRARVLCDPQSLPVWYTQILSAVGAEIIDGRDPCQLPKALKNKTELEGMRRAHVRDGLAVTKLLCWLDKQKKVTELEVAEKLLSLRAASPMFVSPSFSTIAGSGPHGAIVHYRATEKTNRALKKGELFLLDSGGQYPDGTTDITRTVPIGKPSKEHRDRFTRVLKGHIAIATTQFPQGTSGSQLDALARQYLWQVGLDYDHGTGHGVGYFLGVHEGPQRIGKRGGDTALMPGMIVSNEPGYYKTNAYGIRIESLVAVVEKGKNYFGFETLTCAPIDTRLVDKSMLTPTEKKWLNAYHAWVKKQLSGKLSKPEKAWLAARCKAI